MEDPKVNQSAADFLDLKEDYEDEGLTGPCTFSSHQHVNHVLSLYFHSIICILGFVGNSLVVVTYALHKNTKSMTDVLLVNVAVSDLLFVLALPFIVYNELYSWPMGQVACKLLRGSYSVNMYSGMLLLACISTDRYVAIVQARRSFRSPLSSCSRLVCVFVWAFALMLSVPTFVFYQRYEPTHSTVVILPEDDRTPPAPQHVCEMRFEDKETAETVKVAVPSVQLAVGFFLPLLVMVVCYASVIVALMKARTFRRHKAVQMVLAVVAVFIVCHLPYNVVLLHDTVSMFELQPCDEAEAWQTALSVTQSIAYLHCCLKPVVYGFVGVRFRTNLKKVFQDLRCLGKSSSPGTRQQR